VSFVLDSSVALTWCFDDEKTPATESLFDLAGENGVIVPLLWPAETLNGLLMAERRKRISASQRKKMIELLCQTLLEFDLETNDRIWTETAQLAERNRLTVYDAAYLELALRRQLPLATLDEDLRRAANKEKIEVWGK